MSIKYINIRITLSGCIWKIYWSYIN